MMRDYLNKLSLKHKLTLLLMAVGTLTLIVATMIFTYTGMRVAKQTIIDDLHHTTSLIGGQNAVAIAFSKPEYTRNSLKTLRDVTHINRACIYTISGDVFATYSRQGMVNGCPHWQNAPSEGFTHNGYVVRQVIDNYGENIGLIVVESDFSLIEAYIDRQIAIAVLMFAIGIPVAFLLSLWLKRYITKPVNYLVRTTAALSEEKDYTARAPQIFSGEFGTLIDSFNKILKQREEEFNEHIRIISSLVKTQQAANHLLENVNVQAKTTTESFTAMSHILNKETFGKIHSQYLAYLGDVHHDQVNFHHKISDYSQLLQLMMKCCYEGSQMIKLGEFIKERLAGEHNIKNVPLVGAGASTIDMNPDALAYILDKFVSCYLEASDYIGDIKMQLVLNRGSDDTTISLSLRHSSHSDDDMTLDQLISTINQGERVTIEGLCKDNFLIRNNLFDMGILTAALEIELDKITKDNILTICIKVSNTNDDSNLLLDSNIMEAE